MRRFKGGYEKLNSEGEENLMEQENVIERLEIIETSTVEMQEKQRLFEANQEEQTEKINNLSSQMKEISTGQLIMKNDIQRVETAIATDGGQTRQLLGTVVQHILANTDNVNKRKYSAMEKALGAIFGAGGLAGIVSAIALLFN